MIVCLFVVARGGLLMEKAFLCCFAGVADVVVLVVCVLSNWDGEGNCQGTVVGVVD